MDHISTKKLVLDLFKEKFTMTCVMGVIFVAFLFTMDVITTEIVLLLGGIEVNFLMEQIVRSPCIHILIKTGVLIFIVCSVHRCNHMIKDSGNYILTAIIIWYVFVVSNNLCVIISCTG